jgi:hypothetical protein
MDGLKGPTLFGADAFENADGAVGTKMAKAINPVKLIAVSAAAGPGGFTASGLADWLPATIDNDCERCPDTVAGDVAFHVTRRVREQ